MGDCHNRPRLFLTGFYKADGLFLPCTVPFSHLYTVHTTPGAMGTGAARGICVGRDGPQIRKAPCHHSGPVLL